MMLEWVYLLDKFGIFAAISAISTGLIVFITWRANKNLYNISKYANRQKDREIIEGIYHLREKSYREFIGKADCDDLSKVYDILHARDKAKLYALADIESYLDHLYKTYAKGYVLYRKLWYEGGTPIPNFKVEDMNDYHEIVKQLYDLFTNDTDFKKYLKIEK